MAVTAIGRAACNALRARKVPPHPLPRGAAGGPLCLRGAGPFRNPRPSLAFASRLAESPGRALVEQHFDIGVIVARRRLTSPWADHAWLPHAVLPGAPSAERWTPLGRDGEAELFYAGPAVLTLHSSDTADYRDNLVSGRPSLWVSVRLLDDGGCEIAGVTADPYEGEALTEGIGAIVEAVPMPQEIQAKVAAFSDAFHVERPFIKRRRDRADPEALGRRPPAAGPGPVEDQ